MAKLSKSPAINDIKIKPKCVIELNAKNLFHFDWENAPNDPIINDKIIKISKIFLQINKKSKKQIKIKRKVSTKIEILGNIVKNAVTDEGEPSYTSGDHIWNGTILNLKQIAEKINKKPEKQPP